MLRNLLGHALAVDAVALSQGLISCNLPGSLCQSRTVQSLPRGEVKGENVPIDWPNMEE